ncbi:MAG TPA: TonB-dependent receptor [Candidatus Limnocylindria bacterium]|nr:TonB-dependent receptor [Candidatus Limnocylindria bacterium]
MRVLLATGLLCSASAVPIAPAYAQSSEPAISTVSSAALSGIVRDPDGRPIANASVTAASVTLRRTTRSGPDGRYAFAGLPPDTYSVLVSVGGFQRSETDGVTVAAGKAAVVGVSMVPVQLSTIGRSSVVNRSTALNLSVASVATTSGETFAEQGQRQVLNVLDQMPGIDVMRYQGGAPGANSNISIRGAMPYEVQVLLDGHPIDAGAAGAYGFNSTFLNSLLLGGVDADKGPGNMPNMIQNAIGGSLNFRTPPITASPTGDALVGHDSWGGNYFALKFSDTFGKLGVLFGAAQDSTPGYMDPTHVLVGYHTGNPIPGTTVQSTVSGFVNMTQNFQTRSQLAKLSYDFSPATSLTLNMYATQTYNDESGTVGSVDPYTIVSQIPCKVSSTCPNGFYYTAPQYAGLVGKTVMVDSTSGNDNEYDNEPFYSADFRTALGRGTFLASAYQGSIYRTIDQGPDGDAVTTCDNPTCTLNQSGVPFGEVQSDRLAGYDAQYAYPLGASMVTAGFDRHTDLATMCEGDTTSYLGIGGTPYNCTPGAGLFNNVLTTSTTYSLRGDIALTPNLRFQLGNYFSNATGAGWRYDPHAGLMYRASPSTTLRASYGSSYVAPYPGYALPGTNVYGSGTAATLVMTATNDKPETSSGFDVGSDVVVGRDAKVTLDLYSTNIFNRFATATEAVSGTYNGTPYFNIQQNFNQANAREKGAELTFVKAPRVGLGFDLAAELHRDYAYGQTAQPGVGVAPGTIFATANGVQIPEIPYSKETYALTYAFPAGTKIRFGGTSYGASNSLGQPGFAVFDTNVIFPAGNGFKVNVGATNLFNHDDGNVYTINNYGYSYATLSGATTYRQWYPYQPRTFFVQVDHPLGN